MSDLNREETPTEVKPESPLDTQARMREKRKKLKVIQGKMEKLGAEKIAITRELEEFEARCIHSWGEQTYDAKTRQFMRQCLFCDRTQKGKANVSFQ